MTEKLQIAEQTSSTPIDQTELLKNLVAQIRRDSVKNSDEYLDETTVPHGGE